MRCVELCFHERESRAADLAARGLGDAGVTVLRRPITDTHAPAPSSAADARLLLHSRTIAALPPDHTARAAFVRPLTVLPVDDLWPLRASRPWLFVTPARGQMEIAGFWRLAAWAAAQATADPAARIAAQLSVFRALRTLRPDAPVRRRRRPLLERLGVRPLEPIRSVRDWERAVTPLAVAGTITAAAFVSALVVDVAARPEAWGVIAQEAAPDDTTTNAFSN
ncbi:MAG: hypothetical protein NW200_04365 [Hyphomonadaceae bacterium]|nr:hypothetical protein [Hyphomonadaceae bacterium]